MQPTAILSPLAEEQQGLLAQLQEPQLHHVASRFVSSRARLCVQCRHCLYAERIVRAFLLALPADLQPTSASRAF